MVTATVENTTTEELEMHHNPKNDLFPAMIDLKLQKQSVKEQLVEFLVSKQKEEFRYISERYHGKLKHKKIMMVKKKYAEKFEKINRAFDEYVLLSPDLLQAGSLQYGNLRICRYGFTDAYRNALWIHEKEVEEQISEIPVPTSLKRQGKEYISSLKNFFSQVKRNY